MCCCCKKKKSLLVIKENSSKRLSDVDPPSKPPSQWLLWQSYFSMRCFDDKLMKTLTINRVVSPYLFATQLFALQNGSTSDTSNFLKDLLQINGFYTDLDFLNDLKNVILIIPLDNCECTNKTIISTCNKIFIDEKLTVNNEWKNFTNNNLETLKIIPFNPTTKQVQTGEYIMNELQKICGNEFVVSNPATLCSVEVKLLSIIGIRIYASFDAQTFVFRRGPFLISYGNQQHNHPFFVIKGEFPNVVFDDFEAWQIPLKQRLSTSTSESTEKNKNDFSLILIRPNCVGDVFNITKVETFLEIAKAINKLQQIEPKKASLLLPFMDLPQRNTDQLTYGITDMTENWKTVENITNNFENITDKPISLDRLYHCVSLTFGPAGLSFQSKPDPEPENEMLPYIPSMENWNKPKFSHEKLSSRTTMIQKLIDEKYDIPIQILMTRKQKLYRFSARFDSPFIFLIVENNTNSILVSGCYGGKPAMSMHQLTRQMTDKQVKYNHDKKKKNKKSCCIC